MSEIRIAVAQVPQSSNIERNLAKALNFIDKAAQNGVELLCFPETHIPGYRVGVLEPDAPCDTPALENALEIIRSRCKERSIGVIMGTETPNPDGKPFNSCVVIDENGEILTVHHKSKLTPMDTLGYAQPESGPSLFTFKGITMGLVICFEGYRFPKTIHSLAEQGAQLVFHPQFNHVMHSMRWKLPVHESLLVARAAENTLWLITANMCHQNNNCRSMVISPDGLVKEASILAVEILIIADIDPSEATHAFLGKNADSRAKMLGERS